MHEKFSLGIDFGTKSGRALLVNLKTGEEVAEATAEYPHGVMDSFLPDGKTGLEPDWALQHPDDYLYVLRTTIPELIKNTGIKAEQIIGLGIDFTACTMLPIDKQGRPLCFSEIWEHKPHAWVKLWKHHAAQKQANRLNAVAEERGEAFLKRYGGKISSEWLIPKIMQIIEEAPEVYHAADRFMEAADWLVMQICGREARNSCTAGYKAIWHKKDSYPSPDFFKSLHQDLEHLVKDKLSTDIYPIGSKAGEVSPEMAELTGLKEGTAVAVANVDAHVTVPALGITGPGKMLMIMGTSTCHMVLGTEEHNCPGMCGVVEDGILPGYFGYEAGQSCVGDHFEWFVNRFVGTEYEEEAARQGKDIHQYLSEKADVLKPGQSGLLALDWWNGNRSVLVDADLTGMILGMNLQTKPEEIYRALIEATAYGTRKIIQNFEENGVFVDELYAAGGIAEKNPVLMQIYADITQKEIFIAGSPQAPALGSAIFGALAAGSSAGGFDDIQEAAETLGKIKDISYKPIPENVNVYDKLYREFEKLHDYFGRGDNPVMKTLKSISKNVGN